MQFTDDRTGGTNLIGLRNHTILPTPGDPTKMTLSTEETSASPVSPNLVRKVQLRL